MLGSNQEPPTRVRRIRTSVPLPDLLDTETGWYRRWYFLARLGDEITRARKSRRELTLIYGRLPLSGWEQESRIRRRLTLRLGILERESRPPDGFFGRMSDDEFAVCICGTNDLVAAAAAQMIQRRLSALLAETGMAIFPDDGKDRASLLDVARASLDTAPVNVVDMEEYRQRRIRRAA